MRRTPQPAQSRVPSTVAGWSEAGAGDQDRLARVMRATGLAMRQKAFGQARPQRLADPAALAIVRRNDQQPLARAKAGAGDQRQRGFYGIAGQLVKIDPHKGIQASSVSRTKRSSSRTP